MAKPTFMTTQTPELVTVDLTNNRVKLVYARKKGDKTVFEAFRTKKFGENADAEISEFLHKTYKELGIKTKQAICVIPSKLFISKNVDMPSSDPEEISKIIDLQAGRYTPYSREEIIIDYLCMATAGQHYTNVLLIIVNRKLIDRYVQIFEDGGIYLTNVSVASEAMSKHYMKIMPTKEISGAFAGVHIDRDSTDLTVIDKNEMVFVRSIPVGASHFQEDDSEARNSFLSELNKSITSYQDHGLGRPVKGILLTGLTGGIGNIEQSIRSASAVMEDPGFPIKVNPYYKAFDIKEGAGLMEQEDGPPESFFELMSAIDSEASLKIDLIPKEIKLKRRFKKGGREIVTLGIMIMTCLAMLCIFFASKIYIKNNLIDRLQVTSETIANQARILERASTKSRVLRNLIEYRGKGLYVFDKVTSLIGEDIYLTFFSYDNEGKLKMTGTAESMSGVFAFVTKLEGSGYFSSVVTNETKTRKQGSKDVADFDIECTLIEEI